MKVNLYIRHALIITCCFLIKLSFAQVVDKSPWIPNGQVYSIVKQGDIVYVGGSFDKVGRNIPYGAVLDGATGVPDYKTSTPDGPVTSSISDNAGGFFIEGTFQNVGNAPRRGLAHILPDGTVSNYNPTTGTYNTKLLAVTDNHAYVSSSSKDPLSSTYIYNIYCTDYNGNVIWSKPVNKMILGGTCKNNTLYISGRFTIADGVARNEIAAFDALTGDLLPWNVGNSLPGIFSQAKLETSSSELFICYVPFGGLNTITAFDLTTGVQSSWSITSNNSFRDMVIHQGKLYATGTNITYFDVNGAQHRNGLIIIDTQSKDVLNNPTDVVLTGASGLAADNNTIYLSGYNLKAPNTGDIIGDAVAFDAVTLDLLPFKASTLKSPIGYAGKFSIPVIEASNGNVYAGGTFQSLGAVTRNNLYAYNSLTGDLASFAPNFDGQVLSLHATASKLYAYGYYSQVDGLDRLNGLASIDLATGVLSTWNPDIDFGGAPLSLELKIAGDDNSVFVAGSFIGVDGSPRNGAASFDASENLTSWSPTGLIGAEGIIKNGSQICIAAWTPAGNQILFLDATSGVQQSPPLFYENGNVNAMAFNDTNNMLYIGGTFTTVNNVPRTGIAAIDLTTGTLNNKWNPILSANYEIWVKNIVSMGTSVYISGLFSYVNSIPRNQIVALDTEIGTPTNWNVIVNCDYNSYYTEITTLYLSENAIYIGGLFDRINAETTPNIGSTSLDHSNIIMGNVFHDDNANGVKDAGEKGAANILVQIQPGDLFYPTDANGDYRVYAGNGDYTISPVTSKYTSLVTPTNRLFSFDSDLQISVSNDFALQINAGVSDMSAHITNSTTARPGFDLKYDVAYKNEGTITSSGKVKLMLDANILFIGSTPPPDVITGNNLEWNYASLEPGFSESIKLDLKMPIDVTLLGHELISSVTMEPLIADSQTGDNTSTLNQIVTGSFDPNDILVTPKGEGEEGLIPRTTSELVYTVRFQNTGTAEAENVMIKDQLDPAFDIGSFTMVSSSHPNNYHIENGLVKWEFSGINLQDSTTNEPGSHGYVTYSIHLKTGLPAETVMHNAADIYFDFNPAVSTNTSVNTLSKDSQTLTFGPLNSKKFGDAPFILNATSDVATNPVTYTSDNENIATIDGNVLTITGAGTVTITASQSSDANYYDAEDIEQILTVDKADQDIPELGVLSAYNVTHNNIILPAKTNANLSIAYTSSNVEIVDVINNTLHFISPGKATITANQTGDVNYNAAPPFSIELCVTPDKPVITSSLTNPETPVLTSSNAQGNQWFLNGSVINNATASTYKVTAVGIYTVKTTIDGCSSEISEDELFVITGTERSEIENGFSCSPNPANDEIMISYGNPSQVRSLKIFNANGKTMKTGGAELINKHLQINDYPTGLYFVKIETSTHNLTLKFSKK
jgi:uncharacterized repeat protein (TIGR01451 family)